MNHLKIKNFLPLVVILLFFLATRWQNLQSIPVFGDEAIYVRWAQIIKNVETLRFIPLTDGKQPLFMWLTAANLKFFLDPLMASRFISIISGSIILISLYIFSLLFFNLRIAIITGLLYLTLPFSFFFDRLALPDNLLSAFGIISMILAFLLAKYPRFDLSLLLGFALGLAWLTKSPAIYFVVLSALTFFVYHHQNYRRFYLPLISAGLGFIIYNILRLGPQFHQIALRNQDYIWPLSTLINHPLDPLVPHLWDIVHIYISYISLPIILLSAVGLVFYFKKTREQHRTALIIGAWWFLPLIANAGLAKVFTARYILFTLPPLIILLSIGISKLFNKSLIIIFTLCLIPNLFWLYQISFYPSKLSLTSTETGYLSGWTSGWGIKDASDYLIKRSKVANVIVGTEGYFGTLPDGLQIYTDSLKQLTVFGVGIDINQIPEKLIDARNHGDEVYLLFNRSRLRLTPTDLGRLTLIASYPKPDKDSLILYRLN